MLTFGTTKDQLSQVKASDYLTFLNEDFAAYYISLYCTPYLVWKDLWLAKASPNGLNFPIHENRPQSRFRSLVRNMLEMPNMFTTH